MIMMNTQTARIGQSRRNKRFIAKMKLTVLSHYGGSCAVCGLTDPSFLTIDHINGGGRQHKIVTGNGAKFYRWLIRNGFPSGFQVLCWNHNWLKYLESLTRVDNKNFRYKNKLKRFVIGQYGGKCQLCDETNLDILTIDHVNGCGAELRSEQGHGTGLYLWLRRNDFPSGFRVLCFNHNCGHQVDSYNELVI